MAAGAASQYFHQVLRCVLRIAAFLQMTSTWFICIYAFLYQSGDISTGPYYYEAQSIIISVKVRTGARRRIMSKVLTKIELYVCVCAHVHMFKCRNDLTFQSVL